MISRNFSSFLILIFSVTSFGQTAADLEKIQAAIDLAQRKVEQAKKEYKLASQEEVRMLSEESQAKIDSNNDRNGWELTKPWVPGKEHALKEKKANDASDKAKASMSNRLAASQRLDDATNELEKLKAQYIAKDREYGTRLKRDQWSPINQKMIDALYSAKTKINAFLFKAPKTPEVESADSKEPPPPPPPPPRSAQ